jgi:hypothetical protein
MSQTNQLTNLQLELLKLFNYQLSDEQLLEVKKILSSYFAKNVAKNIDKFWEENNWNKQTIEDLKNEHLRTKYE